MNIHLNFEVRIMVKVEVLSIVIVIIISEFSSKESISSVNSIDERRETIWMHYTRLYIGNSSQHTGRQKDNHTDRQINRQTDKAGR
jgi:hypothetical protein